MTRPLSRLCAGIFALLITSSAWGQVVLPGPPTPSGNLSFTPSKIFNVQGAEYGGVCNWTTATGGVAAAGSASFTSGAITLPAVLAPSGLIRITGAGAGGSNYSGTIAAIAGTTVTLSPAASVAASASTSNVAGIAPSTNATASGWVPGDTVTFNSGTNSVPAVGTVSTTKVNAATIAAAGTFTGVTGTYTVVGTTGVSPYFVEASVTLTNGSGITAVLSITYAGAYTTNPTALATEPVTAANLTGGQLALSMGPNGVSTTTPGVYTVTPANPVTPSATSGAGINATFTNSYGIGGAFSYGTNNATAVSTAATAASADSGNAVSIPDALCGTNTASSAFTTARYVGPGQLVDSNGNARGRYLVEASSPPASTGNWNGIDTAFNGDLSKSLFPTEYRLTGTAIGTPTLNYQYFDELTPFPLFLYNSVGGNGSTGSNANRSAVTAYRTHLYQNGQGDMVSYNSTCFLAGPLRAGATSFLANQACSFLNGDMSAGLAGVYENPLEFHLNDNFYDISAVGTVVNLNRNNATGALGAFWAGHRVQSQGTQPPDVAFSAVGILRFGLDLSFGNFGTNESAITLSPTQRIYLDATATDATGLSRFPSSPGSTYITSPSVGTFQVVAGGVDVLDYSGGLWAIKGPSGPNFVGNPLTGVFSVNGRAAAGSNLVINSGNATGGVMLSSAATLTLAQGEVGYGKMTASASAPGATGAKEGWVCGTNAGSLKKIAYAGTSTTPVTLIDNVGSGVTGC